MTKFIEVTGENRERAIENGLAQLGLERDEVSVEVLDNGKKGFLGIGSTPAKVRLSYESNQTVEQIIEQKQAEAEKTEQKPVQKEAEPIDPRLTQPHLVKAAPKDFVPEKQPREKSRGGRAQRERAPHREAPTPSRPKERKITPVSAERMAQAEQQAISFIGGILEKMGIEGRVTRGQGIDEDQLMLLIEGDKLGAIIGRRGDTLDAIQYLTSLVVNSDSRERVRIMLNAEGYREKRTESLTRLAHKMADKAKRYGRVMTLEPMTPFERRVIHATLQDEDGIVTYSTGVEPARRVVIDPNRK